MVVVGQPGLEYRTVAGRLHRRVGLVVTRVGAGHHGPDEWVSISSLAAYRQALVDFARALPGRLAGNDNTTLRAVDGGAA